MPVNVPQHIKTAHIGIDESVLSRYWTLSCFTVNYFWSTAYENAKSYSLKIGQPFSEDMYKSVIYAISDEIDKNKECIGEILDKYTNYVDKTNAAHPEETSYRKKLKGLAKSIVPSMFHNQLYDDQVQNTCELFVSKSFQMAASEINAKYINQFFAQRNQATINGAVQTQLIPYLINCLLVLRADISKKFISGHSSDIEKVQKKAETLTSDYISKEKVDILVGKLKDAYHTIADRDAKIEELEHEVKQLRKRILTAPQPAAAAAAPSAPTPSAPAAPEMVATSALSQITPSVPLDKIAEKVADRIIDDVNVKVDNADAGDINSFADLWN